MRRSSARRAAQAPQQAYACTRARVELEGAARYFAARRACGTRTFSTSCGIVDLWGLINSDMQRASEVERLSLIHI